MQRPEWWEGIVQGTSGRLGAVSLVFFVVTTGEVLIDHAKHWPGGFIPWMVVTVLVFIAAALFSNFHQMKRQRDSLQNKIADLQDNVRARLEMDRIWSTVIRRDPNNSNCVESFQFQIGLISGSADEVLEWEVVKLSLTIGNTTVTEQDFLAPFVSAILPGRERSFRCPLMQSVRVDQITNGGKGSYTIRYGITADDHKFETVHRFLIAPTGFDPQGLPNGWNWVSLAAPTHKPVTP